MREIREGGRGRGYIIRGREVMVVGGRTEMLL
jgi:hypothetical protein